MRGRDLDEDPEFGLKYGYSCWRFDVELDAVGIGITQ
jgi:hypothetical protein